MLRFVPDSWLEVLLRPVLLADPVAGLYAEIHAPDWRFLLVALLLPFAALGHRKLSVLSGAQWRALIGLTLCFYFWTWVSGNARYFLWGLLLVGPLVVVVVRRLPASKAMRNTLVLGAIALQGWAAVMTYEPNVWMLRPWQQGPGLARAKHELASRPAVFLTVDVISHSVLVPQMHPDSRWANVRGQQDLRPGMREFEQLQRLLASPLPKYGILRAARSTMAQDHQPTEAAWAVIRRTFAAQNLAPTPKPCMFMRSAFGGYTLELQTAQENERGFWFCELEAAAIPEAGAGASTQPKLATQLDDVFATVEHRCPRYFPPGTAITRLTDDGVTRFYSHSDTALSIHQAGIVYFKNMRALNPTALGQVQDIRAGRFMLECSRLPGRYMPPWKRGWGVDLE